MTDLDLRVVLAILVIIGGSMAGLGYWLSSYVRNAEIDNVVEINASYMNMLLEPLLHDVERVGTVPPDIEARLDDMLESGFGDRPVDTAVIWWQDATVAYSTDKSIMGQQIRTPHLEAAFGGEVVAWLIDGLTDHGQERQDRLGAPLLEIYVPLHDSRTGAVTAVGEFYQNATDLRAQIERISYTIWATIGLTTALMLALLFLTVIRTRAVVNHHRRELKRRLAESERLAEQNDDLRKIAEEAKVDAFRMNEDLLNQIGSDIHDGPLQLLSLAILRSEEIDPGETDEPEDPAYQARTTELLMRAAQDLRNLAVGLIIPELEALSAQETLLLAVSRHQDQTRTAVSTRFGALPSRIATPLKICLYRIVQETLNNAFWHADGIGQEVAATARDGWIEIAVRDAGPGIAPAADTAHTSVGLRGLERRLKALGGSLAI